MVNRPRRHRLLTALSATSLLLTGALLSGCSGDSSASEPSSKSGEEKAADSPFEKALAYSRCMRENGAPDFPDPKRGEDGGVQLQAVKPQGDDAGFEKAQKACRDKQPQMGGERGGKPLDSAKVAEWAECMRKNGLKDFPDPDVNGGAMELDFTGTDIRPQGSAFQDARKKCQSKWPGGGMMIKGGGPR
ncbi:hypothetical protein [Streptomyces sp. NPDC048172]|uniref:hypothetical protein n=1 Tax=Streptomyces sp. NPDC048172 TaxID=3365505 RepID=UPI0037145AF9